MDITEPQEILEFWFSNSSKKLWFNSTDEFDQTIKSKYETLWEVARNGELDHWRNKAEHALALIILLDQFPLNMFRGMAKSFASESYAIEIVHYAIDNKYDQELPKAQLPFLYMPLMHSENLQDQDLSIKLFESAKLKSNIRFAKHHREIIQKFGRFPHRNSILGRDSSQAELEYLASPEAFTG